MTESDRWLAFIQTLTIRRRDRRLAKLRYNAPQQQVWEKVKDKIDRREPIRLIVLKARREGISTEVESWLMTFVAGYSNVNALVTAHQAKATKRIWNMSKLMVKKSSLLTKIAVVGQSSITVGDSVLEVSTAGSPEAERSADLTAWHASEAAFWPHPEAMLATMQTLPPQDVFSIGVIESTANGKTGDGEMFYQEWQRAEEGESDWVPIFLSWLDFADYQLANRAIEEPDEEEEYLRERFDATDAQLAWRRWAIPNLCQGDIQKFHQEYPSSAEESFIASGLPFFHVEQLRPMERYIKSGIRGIVDERGRFERAERGYLEIFRMPEPGHQYVIGADSSMGIDDDESMTTGHSRSAAEIIDMDTMEQVAEYDAASAPHIMSRHLVGMGRMYNNALIAPEVQASGGGGGREIIVYLRDLEYWNIHRWRRSVDEIQPSPAHLLGWECVDPDAKILTVDLTWVPARQVKTGDKIIGCEERSGRGKGSAYRLRAQTVIDRHIFVAPMVEVELENGVRTRVSTNHPIWTTRPPAKHWTWRQASAIRAGDLVRYLPPWSPVRTYESGKLAAFLDGEGHLALGREYGFQLLISQAVGPTADEIAALWGELGFTATFKWLRHKRRPHEKPITTSGVTRLPDVLRALGTVRPNRLLRRFQELGFGRMTVRSLSSVAVKSVTPIGDGPVVGLTTDPDHTLIADGIVGHNTNARTRPRMLARIREVVMERSAVIHSRRLFNQLSNFGENDSGRLEALQGHDDLIFAWGIALMSRMENYFKMPKMDQSAFQPPDWRALGIRVITEESPQDRMRRLLSGRNTETEDKTFMEL